MGKFCTRIVIKSLTSVFSIVLVERIDHLKALDLQLTSEWSLPLRFSDQNLVRFSTSPMRTLDLWEYEYSGTMHVSKDRSGW